MATFFYRYLKRDDYYKLNSGVNIYVYIFP